MSKIQFYHKIQNLNNSILHLINKDKKMKSKTTYKISKILSKLKTIYKITNLQQLIVILYKTKIIKLNHPPKIQTIFS